MITQRAAFYIAVPLLLGLVLGGNQAGMASYLPWSVSIMYWIGMSFGVWMIFHVSTLATAYLLRPWTTALLLVLLVGAVIGSFPARAAIYWYSPLFEAYLTGGRSVRPMPPASLTLEFLARHVQLWSPLFVLWAAANWASDRWLGFPRYRFPTSAPARDTRLPREAIAPLAADSAGAADASRNAAGLVAAGAVPAVILGRIPPALGRNILALKAEDHYVRFYTDKGDTLILCRINDAIAEVTASGHDGLRVHRSWWVAAKAVQHSEIQGRGLVLTLSNGLQVPVSQTYKELARRSGLTASDLSAANAAD